MQDQPRSAASRAAFEARGPVTIRDVLIIDDHPLMCEALSLTLTHLFGLRRVRQAATMAAALASIRNDRAPDAVVLDLNLPDAQGIDGLLALRAKLPAEVPITVITAHIAPQTLKAALGAGARGFISKSLPRAGLAEAFDRMWRGEVVTPEGMEHLPTAQDDLAVLARSFATLTPQQMKILRLLCQGRPNKVISWELSIAEATVKTHIAAIMSKINARNRTQAALLANKARLFAL